MRAVELDWWMKKDRSSTVSKFEVMEPSLSSFYLASFDFMGSIFLATSKPNIVVMSVHSRYERSASAKAGRNVEETISSRKFLDYTTKDLPVRAELTFVTYIGVKYPQDQSSPKGLFRRKYTECSYYVTLYENSIEIYRELETNMTDKGRRSDVIMYSDFTSHISVVEPKLAPLL